MNIIEATKSCFKQYATFTGRASRSECWWFCLSAAIIPFAILLVLGLAAAIFQTEDFLLLALQLIIIFELAIIVPSMAVDCRRLHDTGKSGAYLLLGLIPLGALFVIIWLIQDGDPNENQYGPNPKSSSNPTYTKVCATCGCTISRSATVCPNCGNDPDTYAPPPRPDRTKTCATCGCTIDAGSRVCPNCGDDPDTYTPPTRPVRTKTRAVDTSVDASPAYVKKPDTGDSSDNFFFPPSL